MPVRSSFFDLWQVGVAHEVTITFGGWAASFVEGPDHQAVTTATVARCEHLGYARLVPAIFGTDVGAGVAFNAQGIQERLFRAEEAHGEQDEWSPQDFLRAGDCGRISIRTRLRQP